MSHTCKLITLTSTPFIKLLNTSFRFHSCCGYEYPECPQTLEFDDNDDQHANTMYQLRKYGHSLPGNQYIRPPFESLPNLPSDVFRCTYDEEIGPGAGKYRVYKNPEYYSYHHMSYYDMHLILRLFRFPCIPTGRKPNEIL